MTQPFPARLKGWAYLLLTAPAGILALPLLALLALGCRIGRRRPRPRVLWGPVPVITIKYWSQALESLGYHSQTLVTHYYGINDRVDFDRHRDELVPGGRLAIPVRDYLLFGWTLLHTDVYAWFFNGGYMAETLLRWLEAPLVKLAGKRIVAMPYGSDIAVPGYLGPFEAAFVADYPDTVRNAARVRRRVDHICRFADVVVRNLQVGYLPRHDVVWPSQLAVDTELWRPSAPHSDADGSDAEVTVVHAPNHRALKGTDALIRAVDALRSEGLRVRLDLLERRPNSEVRAAVGACDIVAEQFLGGYALFAIEAMSCGRPVLSNLRWMSPELRESLADCPIVDTDVSDLGDRLRELVTDPTRRRELGAAGRDYALAHHSYEAVGQRWAELVDAAWLGG